MGRAGAYSCMSVPAAWTAGLSHVLMCPLVCPTAMQNWGLLMFDERRLLYNEVRLARLFNPRRCASLQQLAAPTRVHDPSLVFCSVLPSFPLFSCHCRRGRAPMACSRWSTSFAMRWRTSGELMQPLWRWRHSRQLGRAGWHGRCMRPSPHVACCLGRPAGPSLAETQPHTTRTHHAGLATWPPKLTGHRCRWMRAWPAIWSTPAWR